MDERYPQRCQKCLNYNAGKGNKTCLKCSYYRRYCLQSSPRSKIPIDIVPDAFLVELADTSDEMPCVLSAIKRLPDDLSHIIVARFVAGISPLSLAAILHTSERQILRRQALGMSLLKKMLRKENTALPKKHVTPHVT